MEDALRLAIFCDYENIAIGVREAKFDSFQIHLVLERLLDKGKVLHKKAYADWDSYRSHKRAMHEAGFELIEIPHVSYSGKNSADIRLVVDALDLCYTKAHVDAFAILSGDSDFSPLVSKLRENNKQVIGLGVKNSTSDLLVESCDDFIYYDDLVRKQRDHKAGAGGGSKRGGGRRGGKKAEPAKKAGTGESPAAGDGAAAEDGNGAQPERREEALELLLDTVDALFQERDDNLWGSMVKQTIKRKRPNFSENAFGYRTFSQLLEDAQQRELLEIHKDEKSGGYVIVAFGPKA